MEVVTIDSTAYDSYASLAQYDAYVAASIHVGATALAASDNSKRQALVTMTRILDRQRWKDAYDTQAERGVVTDIQEACIEGALALLDGSDFQSEQNTSQKLQSIKAGSVALTYFRGAEGSPKRFPTIIQELLRDYLAGTSLTSYGTSSGVDGTSSTDDDFSHTNPI